MPQRLCFFGLRQVNVRYDRVLKRYGVTAHYMTGDEITVYASTKREASRLRRQLSK